MANIAASSLSVNQETPPVADPAVLWGAKKIGKAIGRNARQAFYLLETGQIKCARKVASRWIANHRALLEEFGAPDPSRASFFPTPRLLQEIVTAEDKSELPEILQRYRKELDALLPRERERVNEKIADAIRERDD